MIPKSLQQNFMQNKLLYISSLFIPALCGLFFYLPTTGLRNIYYLSIPFLLALLIKNRTEIKNLIIQHKSIWIILFTFIVYMTLSVLWSETDEPERYFAKSKLIFFLGLTLISTFYISYKMPSITEIIKKIYVLAAITSAMILIINYVYDRGFTLTSYRLEGMGRASNPVQASLVYGLSIIAIIYLNFSTQVHRAKIICLKLAMALPPFGVMLLTQSRGPLLALILTLAVLYLIQSQNRIRKLIFITFTMMCIFISSFTLLKDTSFIERKSTGRIEVWQTALSEIAKSPFIGYGLASNRTYHYHQDNGAILETSHIHSLYLSTLFQGGLIGLCLLLSIYWCILNQSVQLIRQNNRDLIWIMGWIMMGAFFGLYDFGGILINVSTEWLVFWWPIGLTLGYYATSRISAKQKNGLKNLY